VKKTLSLRFLEANSLVDNESFGLLA